jgi:protein-L-isoaspartate(D-aspartate) O-methyltransferase
MKSKRFYTPGVTAAIMDSFEQARARMVERQLRSREIADARVLEVMGRVPREAFVSGPGRRRPEEAYRDSALPVGRGQTLSQPYMVARMTEALMPSEDDRLLEIGTGTGYQTAVLAHLVAEVWSVERDPVLAEEARERLDHLGLLDRVRLRVGDGSLGWPEGAPFDGILVTAGAPDVPNALKEQLVDGGRLVVPVGPRESQVLLRITRRGDEFEAESLLECRFVPLVGEGGWSEAGGPTA